MELTTFQPFFWLLLLVAMGIGFWFSLVDRPTSLKLASFLLRALAILLLVLALCRPFVAREGKKLHVVFLVDVSESVDLKAAQKVADEVRSAIEKLNPGDSHSIFAVAKGLRPTSLEELTKTLEQWQGGIADDEFRSASRLADAMLASRLAFPSGKARRFVLFSDGQETNADLAEALATLEREETDVRFHRVESISQPEVSLVSLEPSSPFSFQGEVVRMNVKLAANQPGAVRLRMLHKGVAMRETTVELEKPGMHAAFLDLPMDTPGPTVWTAEIIPAQDHFPINNQLSTTVTVRGKPRILALHRQPRDMRSFARALREQEFEVDVRGNRGLPESMEGLLAFDAIVLADLPATDLTPRQMELLRRYVADFGGGVAMLGSENSFGLGGYYKTPVEEVIPLISRFEKEKENPSLSMVLVIDKSGSMSGIPIALARQAAKAAVELLGDRDQVAVVGFDGGAHMVSEMRSAAERDAIQSAIDSLDAGGGTFLFPAMQMGKEMLDQAVTKVKHMIILTDGQTQQADHLGLTQEMVDSGVTVSSVALGDGAARELLSSIAEVGNGRYYETNDPANMPQIFTKETMQASKSAIKEDLYGPVQVGDHPVLAGYADDELPFALGYVMTEPKPTAQLLLAVETGDPLLAYGRFGLGAGLAYTSDLTERWGSEWLAWADCGKFWAQALRSIVRKSDTEGILTQTNLDGGNWEIAITRRDANRQPISGVVWDAQVLDSNGGMKPVEIAETGLGRYIARIPTGVSKRLTLRLRDAEADKTKVLHFHAPYPAEYRLQSDLPEPIAALPEFDPGKIREGIQPISERQPVASWFAIAALGCLLGGILLRRI